MFKDSHNFLELSPRENQSKNSKSTLKIDKEITKKHYDLLLYSCKN